MLHSSFFWHFFFKEKPKFDSLTILCPVMHTLWKDFQVSKWSFWSKQRTFHLGVSSGKGHVNSFLQHIITRVAREQNSAASFLSLRNQVCFCSSGSSQVTLGQGGGWGRRGSSWHLVSSVVLPCRSSKPIYCAVSWGEALQHFVLGKEAFSFASAAERVYLSSVQESSLVGRCS